MQDGVTEMFAIHQNAVAIKNDQCGVSGRGGRRQQVPPQLQESCSQRVERSDDHEESRWCRANVLSAMRLFAREVNAVTWKQDQCFIADPELELPLQQVQDFFAGMHEDFGTHRFRDGINQLESTHLLFWQVPAGEVVCVAASA